MPRPKKSDEMPLGMAITMTVLGALILLLLVVWAFLVPFVWMQLVYRQVEATVIDKRIAKERWGKHRFLHRLQALLYYEVPPREYREWVDLPLTADSDQGPEIDAVDKQVEIRQRVPAFYDPYHPTTVVLERASLGWSLIPGLLCPSLVLAGGVAGLVSIRRKRNAIAAGDIPDVLDPAKSQDWNEAESVVVDRGERLPVRLRSNANKALDELPCLGCGFAPFVVILLIIFTEQWRAALPPGMWPGIVIAVVLLILFWSVQATRLVQRRLRLLTLEISQHPLRAGESYRVSVAHPDPAALSRLRLELKCKESDSRTSGRITHRLPIALDESGDTVRTGQLDLPAGLPPTLKLAHHEVQWSFEGRVGRWLRWPLRFPVRLESAVRAESGRPAREKRLDEDCVSLWIDTDAPASAGTTLRGGYLIRPRGTGPLRSAELSVLWYTPPPGEEVRKILHEEQHAAANGDDEPLYAARRFEVQLPDGPPSYEGKVVIIRWAVRLRLRYADGDELVRELPFAFTSVPSAEPLPAAAVPVCAPSTLHSPPSTLHDVDAIEMPWGVRYPLPRAKASWGCLSAVMVVAAFPIGAAVLAGRFLLRHQAELPRLMVVLSCLFIVQMVYLARVPLRLFAEIFWRGLVLLLGGFELELRGERLANVARIGPVLADPSSPGPWSLFAWAASAENQPLAARA